MKLRNKKTGEIDDYIFEVILDRIDLYKRVGYSKNKNVWHYNSLAELYDDWEDYEAKEYWIIDWCSNDGIGTFNDKNNDVDEFNKSIGNYFETKEEAEKAVKKLKAWKRLKDKGFEIEGWDNNIGDNYYKTGQIVLNLNNVNNRSWNEYTQISEIKNDLDLLFGSKY